jgi:hypothetical protein
VVKEQALFDGVGAYWDDDCGYDIDFVALILLDEFPIEVRIQPLTLPQVKDLSQAVIDS